VFQVQFLAREGDWRCLTLTTLDGPVNAYFPNYITAEREALQIAALPAKWAVRVVRIELMKEWNTPCS